MRLIVTLLIVLLISMNCSRPADNAENEPNVVIIDPVIPQPQFPGRVDGLNEYLKDNYKWRQGQLTVEGTVYVQFLVLEDGTISEPKIFRGLCETCDAEALRLIKNMPKWIPAKDNGEPMTEKVILPIKFGAANPY